MKKSLLRIPLLLSGLLAAALAHAEVINISANSPGVSVFLANGADYTLSYAPAGTFGATFLAWNPWGSVSGCNAAGEHCTTGFSERFNILGTGGDTYSFAAAAGPYATEVLANAAAVSGPIFGTLNGSAGSSFGSFVPFHQGNDINALFYVPNSLNTANAGGISLILNRVDAVPEPESHALMLAGLGVVGVWSRRRARRPGAAGG